MINTIKQTNRKIANSLSLSVPWCYFPMSEGGVDGANTGIVVANDSRANTLVDADLVAAVGTQWSTNDGWWTGNGTSELVQALFSEDSAALKSIFQIEGNSALIWFQIKGTAGAGDNPFYVGQHDGTAHRSISADISGGDAVRFYVQDDAGTSVSSACANAVGATDQTVMCVINRADNTLTAYDNAGTPGVLTPDSTPGDISSVTTLGLGPDGANKRLNIGAGVNGAANLTNQFWLAASMRRYGFIQLSNGIPDNLTAILTEISYREGGVPWVELGRM